MPLDTARGGPEVARGCDFQGSRVSWVQEALKKTLHGAPVGSVFLDFDQKRALSRPDRRFHHRRTDVGFGGGDRRSLRPATLLEQMPPASGPRPRHDPHGRSASARLSASSRPTRCSCGVS